VRSNQADRLLGAFIQVAAVLAYGYWAWAVHTGYVRYAWALGAMVVAWAVWDVFRVPGDGSARPAVAVPGWVRLIIEAGYLTGAGTALIAAGAPVPGVVFMLFVAVHYSLSHRRLVWLLREGESTADG
jgi:hypothetical protein